MDGIDLEWKVIYVGSAEDSSNEQTLEEVLVGPVPVGVNKFVLESDAPNFSTIPENDILGVTVVLLTCSYKEQEFVRVGYYVNNEYTEEYNPEVGPPSPLDMSKVMRQICADHPRVTRFPITWGSSGAQNEILPPPEEVLPEGEDAEDEKAEEEGSEGNVDEQQPEPSEGEPSQDEDIVEVDEGNVDEEDENEEEGIEEDETAEIDLDDDEETFTRRRLVPRE